MKEDIETLQDLFTEWFYQKDRKWKTLPEFLQANHFGKALAPRDLSDLMLGRALLPYQYASFILRKNPFKFNEAEIDTLNRQSFVKNRCARIIEIDEQNLGTLKYYFEHPRARKYFSIAEHKAARHATERKYEEKISKLRAAKILLPMLYGIAEKLNERGKIEPIEPTKETIKKQQQRNYYYEQKELKKDPDYKSERPQKFKTEEERMAVVKARRKKANAGNTHAQWVNDNTDKVAEYKRNWRLNNIEKCRENSRAYKLRKKLEKLRGIAQNHVPPNSPSPTTQTNININNGQEAHE